jgi:hypothetical protein
MPGNSTPDKRHYRTCEVLVRHLYGTEEVWSAFAFEAVAGRPRKLTEQPGTIPVSGCFAFNPSTQGIPQPTPDCT